MYGRYRVFLLTGCVKLIVRRVLKIWGRSVCNFGRYRGKTRRGAKNSPPPPRSDAGMTASGRSPDDRLTQNLLGFQIGYHNLKLKPHNILFWTGKPSSCTNKATSVCSTVVVHANEKAVSKVLTNQVPNISSSSSLADSACSTGSRAPAQRLARKIDQ